MSEPNETPATPENERLMTTTEVMEWLNLSRTKIWTMIQNNGMPAFKFGGDYRFRRSEVIKWMDAFRVRNEVRPPKKEMTVFPINIK